jgi:hypothetical protein
MQECSLIRLRLKICHPAFIDDSSAVLELESSNSSWWIIEKAKNLSNLKNHVQAVLA